MRNFLKHNFLILLAVFSYAHFALASTITRPYTSADYAGGQKAVGAKVNAEFDNIVNWLNGGNIGSSNLATGGVATTNIADAGVTSAKVASFGLKVTSSSSAYSMSTVVPATITNLSTTFTSTGRPITVSLEPAPATYLTGGVATYGSGVTVTADPVKAFAGAIFFVRDSATTAHMPLWNLVSSGIAVGAPAFTGQAYQCGDFHYTETGLTSGSTYTFAAKVSAATTGTAVVSVVNCRLVVKEEL